MHYAWVEIYRPFESITHLKLSLSPINLHDRNKLRKSIHVASRPDLSIFIKCYRNYNAFNETIGEQGCNRYQSSRATSIVHFDVSIVRINLKPTSTQLWYYNLSPYHDANEFKYRLPLDVIIWRHLSNTRLYLRLLKYTLWVPVNICVDHRC